MPVEEGDPEGLDPVVGPSKPRRLHSTADQTTGGTIFGDLSFAHTRADALTYGDSDGQQAFKRAPSQRTGNPEQPAGYPADGTRRVEPARHPAHARQGRQRRAEASAAEEDGLSP